MAREVVGSYAAALPAQTEIYPTRKGEEMTDHSDALVEELRRHWDSYPWYRKLWIRFVEHFA